MCINDAMRAMWRDSSLQVRFAMIQSHSDLTTMFIANGVFERSDLPEIVQYSMECAERLWGATPEEICEVSDYAHKLMAVDNN